MNSFSVGDSDYKEREKDQLTFSILPSVIIKLTPKGVYVMKSNVQLKLEFT